MPPTLAWSNWLASSMSMALALSTYRATAPSSFPIMDHGRGPRRPFCPGPLDRPPHNHPQRQRRLPDHPAHNIDRAPEDDAATTGNTSIRLALAAAEAAVVTSQPCWMGTPLIGTVVEGGVVGGALVAE